MLKTICLTNLNKSGQNCNHSSSNTHIRAKLVLCVRILHISYSWVWTSSLKTAKWLFFTYSYAKKREFIIFLRNKHIFFTLVKTSHERMISIKICFHFDYLLALTPLLMTNYQNVCTVPENALFLI